MRWFLSLSIGPVGRFIAAGRRSRDLWWGSTWLSECALAVAELLAAPPSELHVGVDLLVPTHDRLRVVRDDLNRDAQYGHRLSNHLLAEVEAEDAGAVRALAMRLETRAREVLIDRLAINWRHARARLGAPVDAPDQGRLRGVLDADAWGRQLDAIRSGGDFLEFYAVWAPLRSDAAAGRRAALERAATLMDARKAARTFDTPRWNDQGLRKSDLDPGRPSVLAPNRLADARAPERSAVHLARRRRAWLGVAPGEDLDAVGLARRIGRFGAAGARAPELGRLPFPPLSRVALDPWLAAAQRVAPDRLADLVAALRVAAKEEHFTVWCSAARDPDQDPDRAPESGLYPFDASLLLEDGISTLDAELGALVVGGGEGADEIEAARARLAEIGARVQALHAHPGLGLPPAYVAVLTMDGDGVGNALHAALASGAAADIVKSLDQFALSAPGIIQRHHGCAFYAAGDELLAFLPVDQVLACAAALAESFAPVRRAADALGLRTSLSGGIVIAHLKHDLRDLRAEAQEALDAAKAARGHVGCGEGWLEVRELPRSGVARRSQERLRTLGVDLSTWAGGIASEAISLRSAEKILEHRDRFAWSPKERAQDEAKRDGGRLGLELLQADLRAQERRSGRAATRRLQERVSALECWEQAERLAAELMIARRLSRVAALRPSPDQTFERGTP